MSDWSGSPYEILLQKADGRIKSFAQEINFEGEAGRVNWLVGGYYGHDKIVDSNRTLLGETANARSSRAAPYPVVPGVTLLNTPLNAGAHIAAHMAPPFRTSEDIVQKNKQKWT